VHDFTAARVFFTAARVFLLPHVILTYVEKLCVEQLFVCTQKMKLLEKPVKPIRAVSFFVSSS
jgi:hypothetical protein